MQTRAAVSAVAALEGATDTEDLQASQGLEAGAPEASLERSLEGSQVYEALRY